MNEKWQGLPYYPINQFYKNMFKEKVYKIPVSTATTCPNREGLKGMEVCIFCDQWGSAAYPENREDSLKTQIEKNKIVIQKRTHAKKFLVYFQSYTNTFTKSLVLRNQFNEAATCSDIVGFVVGTRPDCLSQAVLDLWNEYSEKYKIFIELGVQSFDNKQLEWMKRGHTKEQSIEAIFKLRKKCPNLNLGIHLMFGFPEETDQDIVDAAKICSDLPIDNVKLHNLHVLKYTPLEKKYNRGEFQPIEKEQYAHWVKLFLQHLRPSIAVHRLTAVAQHHEELVAPKWVGYKMSSYQYVIDFLKKEEAYQGQFYSQVF